MTGEEKLFVTVLIVNTLITLLYLLWGLLLKVPAEKKRARDKGQEEFLQDGRGTYVIRFVVMVLCPVIGPCFFLAGTFSIPAPLQRAGGPGGRYLQQGKDKAKA